MFLAEKFGITKYKSKAWFGRILSTAICIFAFTTVYILSCRVQLTQLNLDQSALVKLCEMNRESLSKYVWSHRAHVSDILVDGSIEALAVLLHNKISNFDMDVVVDYNESGAPKYIVAHPNIIERTTREGSRSKLLDLTEFLRIIFERSDADFGGLVTLEPKFDNINDLQRMVDIVQESPIAARVAIIVNNEERLTMLNSNSKIMNIAIPYRTIPSKNLVSPLLVNNDELSHSGSIEFPRFVARSKLQIDMPDIKMIQGTTGTIKFELNKLTIGWVVDDNNLLFLALSKHLDGVISNKPIEICRKLSALHFTHCNLELLS